MTIIEMRDALIQLVYAGHGDKLIFDSENPTFAIAEINAKDTVDANGDPDAFISIEWEEVK